MKQIILTIAIASAFTIQSKAQFLISAGAANQDYSKDIDIDNQGNIISAGYFWAPSVDLDPGPGTNIKTSNGLNDVYLAKFTSSGNLMWVNSFGGTGIDMPHTVINDDSNNILLCGYFSTTCDFDPGAGATVKTSNGGRDAFIAKYDQNGNFQWVVTYGADSLDDAFNLNVDPIGNVYWTGLMEGTVTVGSSTFTTQGEDIILGKISPTGQVLLGKANGWFWN